LQLDLKPVVFVADGTPEMRLGEIVGRRGRVGAVGSGWRPGSGGGDWLS